MATNKGKAPKAESIARAKSYLLKAINKSQPSTVERILKAGYPIEEPIQSHGGNQTSLMFAASVSEPEVLTLLLQYGADLSATDTVGRTALHYCCRGGNVQNLRLLIEKISEQNKKELFESRTCGGITPLMAAIQSCNLYMVAECLNSSFSPFAIDCTGRSCLDYARPFRAVEGEDILNLVSIAQNQWREQLGADQIREREVMPAGPATFEGFIHNTQLIRSQDPSLAPAAAATDSQAQAAPNDQQEPVAQEGLPGATSEDQKMDE